MMIEVIRRDFPDGGGVANCTIVSDRMLIQVRHGKGANDLRAAGKLPGDAVGNAASPLIEGLSRKGQNLDVFLRDMATPVRQAILPPHFSVRYPEAVA